MYIAKNPDTHEWIEGESFRAVYEAAKHDLLALADAYRGSEKRMRHVFIIGSPHGHVCTLIYNNYDWGWGLGVRTGDLEYLTLRATAYNRV